MKTAKLLQTDQSVQKIVYDLLNSMSPDECLFAVEFRSGVKFVKIKIADKHRFRRWRLFSKAIYITSQHVRDLQEVEFIGKLMSL